VRRTEEAKAGGARASYSPDLPVSLFVGAAVASVLALASCRRDSGSSASRSGPPPAAVDSGAPLPHHTAAVDLKGLKLTVSLPDGWERVQWQYDTERGAAVFEPGVDTGERGTSFLDASKDAHVPASATAAVAEVEGYDRCSGPSECAVLGSETIPGGYLVVVRGPKEVYVESWRTMDAGRALHCGFRLWEPAVATLHGGTWLDDAAAVARARKAGEDLCGSVKPAG
jgi:hypothetical protein